MKVFTVAVGTSAVVRWEKPLSVGGAMSQALLRLVVFNLGYVYPRKYATTSYINQNETEEPLEP
jgi:hypothetical protein